MEHYVIPDHQRPQLGWFGRNDSLSPWGCVGGEHGGVSRLDNIPSTAYIVPMVTIVEHTDEFESWYLDLDESEREDITAVVELLEEKGPRLPFPHSSGVNSSRHSHMRELRVQSGGNPVRIFYAFDPRRQAILLIGGDKTGDDRFYEKMVPVADDLYDVYLEELHREGLIP